MTDDLLADLPAPLDDEPSSVRRDIADELADHLACAYRREGLKGADDVQARQAVLQRFGDPRRIAYRLWFQALWGRIMWQRITFGMQGVLTVGVLVVAFLLLRVLEFQASLTTEWLSLRQQSSGTQQMLSQILQRLPAPPPTPVAPDDSASMMGIGSAMGPMTAGMMGMPAPGGDDPIPRGGAPSAGGGSPFGGPAGGTSGGPATAALGRTLELQLTMAETNAPAVGCHVAVIAEGGNWLEAPGRIAAFGSYTGAPGMMTGGFPGRPAVSMKQVMIGSAIGISLTAEDGGVIKFGRVDAGRYTAYVEFVDGRACAHRFTVAPPEKSNVLRIVCPLEAKKAYVTFWIPKLPAELAVADVLLAATVQQVPSQHGAVKWRQLDAPEPLRLWFDPKTGAVARYQVGATPDVDLNDVDVHERFLTMPVGAYAVEFVQYQWPQTNGANSFIENLKSHRAAGGAAKNGQLSVTADMRDVLFNVPETVIQELRNKWLDRIPSTTQPTEQLEAFPQKEE